MIPPSLLRRAMPVVIVMLIVGMIVAMVATGMRLISPQTLFFPFVLLLAATALYRGNDNKMRTEEVDAERADYLRYLSVVRDNVRAQAAAAAGRRRSGRIPNPAASGRHARVTTAVGTRPARPRLPGGAGRPCTRSPLDTALRVNDAADEVDLEPVSHSALRSLLDTQRTVRDVPTGIDLTKVSRITVLGDADEVRGAVRAWVAQAVTWHDPTVLGVALATRDLEIAGLVLAEVVAARRHSRPKSTASARPATCPPTPTSWSRCWARRWPTARRSPGGPADALRHLLIVVDDPGLRRERFGAGGRPGRCHRRAPLAPHAPHREQYSDPERPILRHRERRHRTLADRRLAALHRQRRPARRRRRRRTWPAGCRAGTPTRRTAGLRSAATRGATFTTLLGIPDASRLDVPTLWAPRHRDDELRVPIGVTATGEPLIFDLKDEAEGGMGPHGLMIGMTGSGKSQTLMSILLSLLTTHSADRLIVIYADFKGEAGADIFRNFPQVVAVISNMAEKKSLADRFADTLRGEVARRETLLREAGRQVQGSAFNSVTEYENAIAAGHDLPPIPTLFVVADEFTLMLADHPEYAELFDYVARKGRSFRIHILFASQTLDVGKIKDIDKNTSYRIGLKVASASGVAVRSSAWRTRTTSSRARSTRASASWCPLPVPRRSSSAAPMSTASTIRRRQPKTLVVHSVPEPKLFTAGRVEPDQTTVIAGTDDEEPVGAATQADRHHRRPAGALRPARAASCGCRRSTSRFR